MDCAIRGAAIGGGEFAHSTAVAACQAAFAQLTLLACTGKGFPEPLTDPIVCDLALAGFESIRSGKSESGRRGRGNG